MPADFYQDTFTVSTDTALASHTPELGGTYSFATDLRPATSATVAAATDRLSFPTAAITVAKNSVVVPNANYSLSGFIVVGVNGDFRFDAMLRKVGLTGYYFFCNTGSMSILLDSDAGTVLASATPPSMNVAAGLIPFTLSAIGSTISFTMGAVTINATNSARTAAGEFIFGGRDVEFDTLSGVDPDASGDTTAPTITGPTGSAGASTSTKTQAENITAVHTFSANEAATWSLNGGADVARFSINSTTGALAFATAPNFEAPNDSDTNNTYVVGVRATDGSGNASTQTLTVTITNANEAPTFGGTISLPVLTATVAMASYATAGFFGDPDAGDTAAYSAIGTWPAGVTVNSGSGAISGTPTTAGTYAGLQVRRTDSGALTIDSNTFSIVVAAAGGVTFTGTVPNQSGTVGVPFTALALSGYFSGAGNFAVQSGTLPAGLTLNTTTGTISGTPTTAATSSGVVIRRTATSGIPATADTNAFSFTIAAVGGVAGFDLQTAAGCVFGQISGALAGLSREVGVGYKIAVYDPATRAIVGSESATLTTDSAGRLPRFTNASCSVGVTYDLTAKRVSDGAVASFRLAAT